MNIELKNDVEIKDILDLHPNVYILISFAVKFTRTHGLPLVITSMFSDRGGIAGDTGIHGDKRAFDMSVKGWPETLIHKFCFECNRDHREIAAISLSDHVPRAAVFHEHMKHGEHLHLQCRNT